MKRKFLLLGLSLPLILLLVASGYYYFDLPAAAFCRGPDGHITAFFQVVTAFGVSTWYLIGSAVLFLYFFYVARHKARSYRFAYLFCAVAISGLATDLVKWLMGRWRPKVFFAEGLYGFGFWGSGYEQTSFPSGHAATICSLALALSYLYPRWRPFWIVAALLVCLSRVVIGAHYPSDVLMGAYIGFLTAFLLRYWSLFGNNTHREKTYE